MSDKKTKEIIEKMSHDVNGQISILRMKISMLIKIVPELYMGFEKAKDANLIEPSIPQSLIDNLDDLLNLGENVSNISEITEKTRACINSCDENNG